MCKQKRRAKQRDDELEFSHVPYSDPNKSGRLLVTVIEAGGGGHLPVLPIFSTSSSSVTFICAKYRIFVSFFYFKNLVPLLFTLPLPPIPISHKISR